MHMDDGRGATMRMPIVKCHGSGNDFPLIDARAIDLDDAAWARVARALADRDGPVGGDGILVFDDRAVGGGALPAGVAFRMTMRNSDGTEAETCLNGLRCVARMGFEALGIDSATVALKTSVAQVARTDDLAPGVYTVRETAAPASLDVGRWPMAIGVADLIEGRIAALSDTLSFTAVAMPNPHLVAFVDAIDECELVRIGTLCEAAPDWLPNRANVSFVEVRGDGPEGKALFVRTFERGVGLTDSCGSAMAASTYAAGLTRRCAFDRTLTVYNRGGRVRASADADGVVTLSGNATWDWQGTIEIDPRTGTTGMPTIGLRFAGECEDWLAAIKS